MSTAFVDTRSPFRTTSLPAARKSSGTVTGVAAAPLTTENGAFRRVAPKSRMHLTRRGRVVLTVLASIPLVFAATLGALNAGAASASDPGAPAHFEYVTVHSGQSLWSIAESVAPSADPRDVIAAIVTLNGLHQATVVPGERLAIPAQYDNH